MIELWEFYLERLDNLEGKPGHTLISKQEGEKMRRQLVNSLIAGVFGIVLLDGSIEAANATQQSTSGGKIYKVYITIKYPKSSQSWRSFFEASFNKKTPFQSVEILSSREWYGVRGWVKVERDGLHYQILMKDTGKPSHIVRGKVTGNQQEYRVRLNDKN